MDLWGGFGVIWVGIVRKMRNNPRLRKVTCKEILEHQGSKINGARKTW